MGLLSTVNRLSAMVDPFGHLLFERLRHPYDTAESSFGFHKLLGGNEVFAMAHKARRLHAAAGHRGHL